MDTGACNQSQIFSINGKPIEVVEECTPLVLYCQFDVSPVACLPDLESFKVSVSKLQHSRP